MIGAMPAVSVRHERRRQEKRSKRPCKLYLGGHWLSSSASASPSPGAASTDLGDQPPELYVCGKLSALQLVVGCILFGTIILVVGLVQLTPNAADADHRWVLVGTGSAVLAVGFFMTALRCWCLHFHARRMSHRPQQTVPPVTSVDGLVHTENTQVTSPASEGGTNQSTSSTTGAPSIRPTSTKIQQQPQHHHHHHHHHQHHESEKKEQVANGT